MGIPESHGLQFGLVPNRHTQVAFNRVLILFSPRLEIQCRVAVSHNLLFQS